MAGVQARKKGETASDGGQTGPNKRKRKRGKRGGKKHKKKNGTKK